MVVIRIVGISIRGIGYMDSMVSWSRLSIDTDYTREGGLPVGEGIW